MDFKNTNIKRIFGNCFIFNNKKQIYNFKNRKEINEN